MLNKVRGFTKRLKFFHFHQQICKTILIERNPKSVASMALGKNVQKVSLLQDDFTEVYPADQITSCQSSACTSLCP